MNNRDREKIKWGLRILAILVALSLVIGIIFGSAELLAMWGI